MSEAPPAPPEKPHELECCGRGCSPCVFDYYDAALAKWCERVRALGHDPSALLKALEGR